MVLSLTNFETSQVQASERIASWSGALARLCGKLDMDGLGASTVDGSIECGTIDRLKLCRIEASQHRISLPPLLARIEKHPVVKVVFQEHGRSVYEQDGHRIVLSAGEGIVYDVSRPHQITSASLSKHLVVIMPRETALLQGMRFNHLASQRFSTRDGVGRLARDMVRSTLSEVPAIAENCESEIAQTILNLLYLPLARISRTGAATPATTLKRQIKAYIRANLRNPDLSIDKIAAALQYSKSYLHRSFADEDVSISDYIWIERLECCGREVLLSSDSTTLTEIAFSYGFNSSSHFSRLFKRRFGVAPSLFAT